MRLVGLRFRGLGPYKDEFLIDFAAVTAAHMFIIDGETGAGKTTILDAITFALYGSVSGNSGGKSGVGDRNRLRSRFLNTDPAETFVDLIFSVGEGYYEILRKPDYDKAKKRGDGVTKHPASARMTRLDPGFASLVDQAESMIRNPREGDGSESARRYFDYVQEPGHATVVTTSVREVTPEVERLLGLDRSQFSKTIILAQGRFAEFLGMRPEERTDVVKDLFSAGIYEDVERQLDAMRVRENQRVTSLRDDLRRVVGDSMRNAEAIADARGHVVGAADDVVAAEDSDSEVPDNVPTHARPSFWGVDDSGDIDDAAHSPDEIVDIIAKACSTVAEDGDVLDRLVRERSQAATTALEEAQNRYERVARACRAQKRLERATADVSQAHSQDEQIARQAATLDRAREAAPLVAMADRHARDERQSVDATKARDEAQAELDQCEDSAVLEASLEEAFTGAALRGAAQRALDVADAHAKLVKAAKKALSDFEAARSTVDAAVKKHEGALAKRAELPDSNTVESKREANLAVVATRDGLRRELDDAKAIRRAVQDRDKFAKKKDRATVAVDAARVVNDQARRAWERALSDRALAGAAGYAADLKDGVPCPVCGGTDHPHPAVSEGEVPDEAAVKALRTHADECESAWESAKATLSDIVARLSSYEALAQGHDVKGATDLVDSASAKLAVVDAAERELAILDGTKKDIALADGAVDVAGKNLAEAKERLAAAESASDHAGKAALGMTADSVEAERLAAQSDVRKAQECDVRVNQIKEKRQKRETLANKVAQWDATVGSLSERIKANRDELHKAVEDSVFDDVDEVREAMLDDEEIVAIGKKVDAHRERVIAVEAEKKAAISGMIAVLGLDGGDEQTIAEAMGADPAMWDERAAQDAVDDARDARDEAIGTVRDVETLTRERCRLESSATACAKAWMEGMARYVPIRDVSLLARGDTPNADGNKVTLVTYAVTERFRDVLDRANDLLRDIHDGVYELRLGDHEGRAGARTGLPIMVYDRRTDLTCEPGTLSGGETFFVSLALALALADVIRAHSGGASMDTLFIDEGFGTLSQDYLDEVVEVLRHISTSRDVGIISHVGHLRDRIPVRIEVSRVRPEAESTLTVHL